MRQRTTPASQGDTPSPWTFLRPDDYVTKVNSARTLPADEQTADEFVLWHLSNRTLLVDTHAGVVCKADGITRAEYPQKTGYGKIYLGKHWHRIRWAPAHRVVWIAAHGPIPGTYQINHRNSHRWDNRLENLDMVTPGDNMRHARGLPYEHVPGVPFNGPSDRPHARPYATGSIVYARNH